MRWLLVAVTLSLLGPARAESGACPVASADREYLQTLIAEQDRRNDLRFHAAETAIGLATEANNKQFVAVQNYLTDLIKQTEKYVPRAENQETWAGLRRDLIALDGRTNANLKDINDKLAALSLSLTQSAGRGEGISNAWSIIVALAGLLLAATTAVIAFSHRKPR